MSEFVRLPNRIVNLSTIACIEWDESTLVLHYPCGPKLILNAEETAVLVPYLEDEYGLMTASAARLATKPKLLEADVIE